ncbi:hypothetical protein EG329_001046 [Mollisiaceae sp. DMI_Dod_QoI]|nr:hypothetical protein EG329_001046 [Helotiales sp. DMI_Dod_QoI]
MKHFILPFLSILISSPALAAPAASPDTLTSPNPRSKDFVAQPGFNKEACCKCWTDLYINGADWQVLRRPRPCDGDCVCDWCGTNNADATYGTPCAGAGNVGAWGFCVANCNIPPPSGSSATPPTSIIKTLPPITTSIILTLPPITTPSSTNIIKTLPPITTPAPSSSIIKTLPPTTLSTSIIKTLPPTTLSAHPSKPTSVKPPPPPKEKRQDQTITYTIDPFSPTTATNTDLPVITDTTILSSIWFSTDTSTDTFSLAPTSSWTGDTTIVGTGTLSFGGGSTQTFTFSSETFTLTFPPAPTLTLSSGLSNSEEDYEIDVEEHNDEKRTLTHTGGPWTTGTNLPVQTTWYGGGPGFSLTFTAEVPAATSEVEIEEEIEEEKEDETDIEIEERQINTITWGQSTLPATTSWGRQTITGGGFSLTFTPEAAAATSVAEIEEKDDIEIGIEERQINTITWGESTLPATTFWGGETITIGGETITFGGPGMSLTIGSVVEATAMPEIGTEAENVVEIEERQINTITWGESTLPATTFWGGETITIGGETITFGGPGMSLTIGAAAEITASPEIVDEEKR